MSKPALEILIIFLLLVVNGVFAMAEIAIVSARKARLQRSAESGDAKARTALELANEPNQFLATVQIGITLVGILAGAFGGATIARQIAALLENFPIFAPYAETIGVIIVVIFVTFFSLVIGELVPKRLALNNRERIASSVAAPMRFLSKLAAPLVRLLNASSDLVIRLMGVKPSQEPAITPEEIKVLIELGRQSGVFEASEQDMIESVLRLHDRRADAFMTPRRQIVWFDIDDTFEEIRVKVKNGPYSSFPVAKHEIDNVLGIVHAKDLLNRSLTGAPLDIQAMLHTPLFVPEGMSALKVLELLKQKGTHIALITDEYGSIQGIVTYNDILEDIAGYIPSEWEPVEPLATRREDGSWLLDGLLHIDELKEIFKISKLPDEEQSRYQTIGGFVMTQVGSIPTVGQNFEWEDLRFEVVDMDGRRVDKVLVTPILLEKVGDT